MGSMSVSSCRCCMFVSCVHPVAVLNAAFCMTCSLLMLFEDARVDYMEEAYSRAVLMTALLLLLLFAFQSMFISIWVSRLEIAEFPESVRRSAP